MTGYLLDVNVLLALTLSTHHHHVAAHRWFSTITQWSTTPLTESAFVRLLLNPRLEPFGVTATQALAALAQVRDTRGHRFLGDDTSLSQAHLNLSSLVGTKQVTDFHLVNLAARHGVRLATFDGSLFRCLAPADQHHVHLIDW